MSSSTSPCTTHIDYCRMPSIHNNVHHVQVSFCHDAHIVVCQSHCSRFSYCEQFLTNFIPLPSSKMKKMCIKCQSRNLINPIFSYSICLIIQQIYFSVFVFKGNSWLLWMHIAKQLWTIWDWWGFFPFYKCHFFLKVCIVVILATQSINLNITISTPLDCFSFF